MQTDTELGYKCLIIPLGVSVTWPKTTATQKGSTVPSTTLKLPAQAKDLVCKGTLWSSVWAQLSGLWQWGAAGFLARGDTRDSLCWSQTAQQQPAQESENGWGWKGPVEVTWSNLPAPAKPTTKAGCLGPCPDDSWVPAHMETPQPLQAACASAPSPWH